MTRINVIDPGLLMDQFLLAEYRELPMVIAAARRSLRAKKKPTLSTGPYTLNKGHVTFFYNKAKWLEQRYELLIAELRHRGYDIDPDSRLVDFSPMYQFPQMSWTPTEEDKAVNLERLRIRHAAKPQWYRWNRVTPPMNIVRVYTEES